MAEEISVPIRLPTDSSSVSAAKDVVAGLQAAMKALGPAAAAGSSQAQAEMKALQAAALAAQKEVDRASGGGKNGRDARGRFLPGAGKPGAPTTTPEGGVDVSLKAIEAAEKKRLAGAKAVQKQILASEKKAAKEKADLDKASRGASFDKALGSAAMGAATAGVAAMTALYAAIGMVAVKFASATIAAQAFKEATLGAYAKLLGGAGAADKAFKQTIATADQIGMSYEDALRGVNSLIAKGFKADQAQDLVKAMADLKSVVPDANIGNLLLAITQIKSKGVLQMEELQGQIAEAGLSVSVVLEEIGKGIGKSGQEVRKMISQGKISADQGVQGIMAAIQKTTGKPIGKAAEEASKSLGGLLSRLEQIPQGLLLMADSSKGLETVKGALGNVLGAFAPSTEGGKALSAAFGKLGDAFATFLSGLTGAGGADSLQKFALGLASVITQIADAASRLGTVLGPRIGKAVDMMGDAMGDESMMNAFIGTINLSIDALILLLNAVDQARDTVGAIGAVFSTVYNAITGAAQSVYTSAQSIGTNLVQGIIAGISLASPMLAAAIQGLAAMSTGTMQGATQINSPSKLWRDEIGYQLPAGAAEGMYDGAPLMATAARDVGGMTTRSGANAASSAGGAMVSGAGGRVYSFAAGAIVIQVQNGNARSIAADLMTELEAIV